MSAIAFIGLGNMGGPMVLNLIKAGHTVKVFDLVSERVEAMVNAGAQTSESAQTVCEQADTVISMLPAGKHVTELYLGENGLLNVVQPGTLIIDSSTIDAESARLVHQQCVQQNLDMVDAPVSGGVAAAQAGTLTFMCGGSEQAFLNAKSVLTDMGKNIFHAGPGGAGQVAKMCNNMLLAIHMIGTSEALKLGSKNGLDPKVLSEIMLASSGRNWSLELYNPYPGVMENSPASNNYQPGFMVDLMTKDLGLAIANAESTQSNTPLGKIALKMYKDKQAEGDGSKDFSSIIESIQN